MDFTESGMDPKQATRSTTVPPTRASCCASTLADEFHFRVVDARRSIGQIQDELRRQVATFLEETEKPAEAPTTTLTR
jgi:hypothetical protein